MRIAIMQPYFLPYLGYYQLIKAVDKLVVYDNIEYTKKGWINRNRFLLNGNEVLFTIPLARDSDFLHVNQRSISSNFEQDKQKILAQLKSGYRKAPYYNDIYPVIESIFNYKSANLFDFIFNSITTICNLLEIKTEIIVSSALNISPELKGAKKVVSICSTLQADSYINPIGGIQLYKKDEFREYGIDLFFHNMEVIPYPQNNNMFISHLSIIDVLMHNSNSHIQSLLNNYQLICSQ